MLDTSRQNAWADMQTMRRTEGSADPLHGDGGGGTSGPVDSDNLKSRVDFLHTAFLWIAGLLITALVAIVTVILTVSSNTNGRIDKIPESISALNREVGRSGDRQEETNRRLEHIETRLEKIGAKLGAE